MRGSVPAAPSAITQIPGLSRNAVIAASAGTGKTQKLTDIYLVAVLGLGPDGRTVSSERIVATTFSRSAAQEIRERLEVRLGRLCNGEGLGEERLLRELATALEVAPAELRQRANRALEQLPLSTIDTLHGLALNLVRSFALDLGFPPSLVVLEEEEALADTAATVDSVFTSALEEGGEPALAAVRLIDACVGLENARFEVATLIERLNDEAILPADLATGLHVKARDELIGDLCAQDQTSEVPGLKSLLQALLHGKRPALSDLSEALARFLAALSSRRRRDDASLQTLLRSAGGNTAAERLHALSEFLLRAEDLDQEVSRVIQLISEVQRRLSASRAARGVASFGDLLRIARKGLRDHPELALAAALRIDLLLVDEFQDTNGAQRDFLLLLRERPESIRLRRPGDLPTVNDISERGLVVVGDRKQSIYGFRGADVAVFARFAAELAGEAAAEALALRGVRVTSEPRAAFHSLRQNHRCALAILDAVNRIAQHDFEAEPVHAFEIRYMPAELLAPPEEAGTELGRVTLIEDDGTVPANASALALGARGALRSALLAGSFCERARWEGFGWRDIAVLARRRATLALVELALEERKIPFVVSGRALYATVEVRDLFSALRLAVDPLDRRALSVVARGTLGGLSDSTLAELSREDHGLRTPDQWRQVEIRDEAERAAVAELGSRLEVWIRTAPRLSPRDAIQFALECFQLESVFSGLTRPEARLGNVGRLLEIAAHHGGSLPSFVRWLGRQIALDADESEAAVFSEEDDAVRLLTIHASKGLAFPAVILLDAEARERPRVHWLDLHKQAGGPITLVMRHRGASGLITTPLFEQAKKEAGARARAERQRLSYVALTRAERELAIVLPSPNASVKDSLAQTLQRLLNQRAFSENPCMRMLSAAELLRENAPPSPEPQRVPQVSPPARPDMAACRRLTVGATALADFEMCARRFQLLHVVGLSEPQTAWSSAPKNRDVSLASAEAADDPRSLGSAAHRLLERWPLERWGRPTDPGEIRAAMDSIGLDAGEGDSLETARGVARFLSGAFAKSLSDPGLTIHRELSLVTPISPEPRSVVRPPQPQQLELFAPKSSRRASEDAPAPLTLLLKTTFDLLVVRSDGSVDIIDYKRSPGPTVGNRSGSDGRYRFQLAAYAMAARHHFRPWRLRAGLVYLLSEPTEPVFVDVVEPPPLRDLAASLQQARWANKWPAVPIDRCRRARCGFVESCHPHQARA